MDLMHHKCYHPFIAARHSHPQGMPGPKKGRTSPHHNHIDAIINNITSFFIRQSFFQIFFPFFSLFPVSVPARRSLRLSPAFAIPQSRKTRLPGSSVPEGGYVLRASEGFSCLHRHSDIMKIRLFSNSALLPGISVLPVNNLQIARASLKGVGSDLTVFGYLHQQKIGAVGKGAAPDMRAVARNHHHLHRHA